MKKLLFIFYFFAIVFFFAAPFQAHAQDWGGCVKDNVASLSCLPIVFGNIINAALLFVGTVALFLFIYAGIVFIRSGGDPKQVQSARQIITYAIIGLVIVLCSYAIITVISYVTGAKCIEVLSLSACN
jgi:hypothetical protein